MAKENPEMSDLVKKCKILLLDIEGTTTSISFVKDKLFPYAEENVKGFLESQWDNADVREAVAALRKLAIEDQENCVQGVVAIPAEDAAKDEQIEALVKNVKWQMSADRKSSALKQLQGLVWRQGYDSGDIKGHIYDDVLPALELWRSTEGQKVYIYSSGSVQAQKLLFSKSLAGDMLPLIEGHFDTAVGAKQEAASYAAIAEKIGCKAEEILFLTDIVKEAEAARSSSLSVALVSREGNAPLPADVAFPVLHSFEQLTPTNKRKPDPQIEEIPAKVLKTEEKNDVKTTPETGAASNGHGSAEPDAMESTIDKTELCETMEVEESKNDTAEIEPAVVQATKLSEVADVTMIDAENDTQAENNVTKSINKTDAKVQVVEEKALVDIVMDTPSSVTTDVKVKSPKADKPKAKMVDAATLTESIETPKSEETLSKPIVKIPIPEIIIEAPAEPIDEENEGIKTVTVEKQEQKMVEVSTAIETPMTELASDETPAVINVLLATDKPIAKPNNIVTEAASPSAESDKISTANGASLVEPNVTESADPKFLKEVTEVIPEGKTVTEEKVTEAASLNGTAQSAVIEEITVETVAGNITDDQKVADALTELEPVVEEKEEKSGIDTKKMEIEAKGEVTTVTEPTEVINDAAVEETQPEIEIKDVTDEQTEEADIIMDMEPIVEEPSQLADIEALQNAGDVLEKECDEILSKVQDVTSMDYIPVKPLHTIVEEMETENIDSNDIVEGILDTEMELSMKPDDIDLNIVQEITESKTNDEIIALTAEQTIDAEIVDVTEENLATRDDTEMADLKPNEKVVEPPPNNVDIKETIVETVGEKNETKIADSVTTEPEQSAKPEESKHNTETPLEHPTKLDDTVQAETTEVSTKETNDNTGIEQDTGAKLNGKANGDATVKLNGNANTDDLKSRLTAENGKEKVNGSNGDVAIGENNEGEQIEAEIPDIKVKTVATEEAHPPIEQPVEA